MRESSPRFAVAFVTEQNEPVGRPMWIAEGARANVDFGSYRGDKFQVTDQPDRAASWANRETAERWADRNSATMPDGRVIYRFEAVEAPEGSNR